MEIRLDDGLNLAPKIANFLQHNGIFTNGDLLFWTIKAIGKDSLDVALDRPVMLPWHIQAYLNERGIVTLRDLLSSRPGTSLR